MAAACVACAARDPFAAASISAPPEASRALMFPLPIRARALMGRGNMSALDASGGAEMLAAAKGSRAAQATQAAAIAARLERLPLTSYQKGIFAIIATAWFFASMDLGAL